MSGDQNCAKLDECVVNLAGKGRNSRVISQFMRLPEIGGPGLYNKYTDKGRHNQGAAGHIHPDPAFVCRDLYPYLGEKSGSSI